MRKSIKWLPIILIETYLLFTLLLYRYGPWQFETGQPVQTYTLLVLYQFALFLGYFVAMRCSFPHGALSYKNRSSIIKIVKVLTIVNILFGLMVLTRDLGLKSFSLSSIYERFVMGIRNPAQVYSMKFGTQVEDIFLGKVGTILIVLWSPVFYSVIPLSCLLFKKFNLRWKVMAIMNIIILIVRYVATGTNKGIFDIVIFFIAVCFINFFQKVNTREKKIRIVRVIAVFLLMLIPALLFFNKAIGSRGIGSAWKEPWYALGGQIYLNKESLVFKYLPDGLISFIVLLSSYLCQGYYGFSLISSVNWTPMFGLGNSMFLVEQLNLKELTYQYKVQTEFGWDARVQWHSIYSWLANDFGIYGVILIMFLIGFLFAILYKESILFDNPVSELLLVFFLILFFYIPANNQIVQGLEAFSSFYFAILLWFLCKNHKFVLRLKR